MASDKIAIDRELFERLTHAAIALQGAWHWKAGETRLGHADTLDKLASLVREAVAIRDAPPQMMTDGEREALVEAGKGEAEDCVKQVRGLESVLATVCERLQVALGETEEIEILDVVEKCDVLLARHSHAIAEIREAQRKIIEWIARTDLHADVQLWRGIGGVPVVTVGIREFYNEFGRAGRTTAIDSHCLLVQIAEAIDEWKRIHLR